MNAHGWNRFIVPVTALLFSTPLAKAFVATGPDDELFATGTVSAQYNDNLFLSNSNVSSDEVFDLVPGLEWDFGKKSANQGYFSVANDVQLFASNSKLDTDLPSAAFVDAYDDGKTKLNFDGTYQLSDNETRDVHENGILIKHDYYHADGTGEVSLSDKTSASVGAIFDDTAYRNSGGAKWSWVEIPVKYYYRWEPKLDLSGGFSFTSNNVGSGGNNSDVYYLNVGARGEFTEKLTGQFDVGYQQIDFTGSKHPGNQSGVGATSGLNYAYSPKTTFNFSIQNVYGYSPLLSESSYRNFAVTLGAVTAITEQWKLNGSLSYGRYDYISTTEQDDFYTAGLGVNYLIDAHLTTTLAWHYSDDNSNVTALSFKDNTFTISLTAKY